jgi:glutamine synthetase
MTPTQVLKLIKSDEIEYIDLRFMDFPGLWQHKTYPAKELTQNSFTEGFGFDGSAIRGWEAINEGDMMLLPVADTARIDLFCDRPTLSIICDVKDPVTKKQFSRDPRSIARKASHYLQQSGIADTAFFGPETEFFIFDRVRYDQTVNRAMYEVDSEEGIWNRGSDSPVNLGNQVRAAEGHFPTPPTDRGQNLRSEMVNAMLKMNIPAESHHHEVATGGQGEIDLHQQDLVTMADSMMFYKYIVKSVAARHGKVATFMPKPLFGDNGSGMHTHFSLWKDGKTLMNGRHYAGLSKLALYAIGGLLRHARSLVAFTNPTTNSFKRLVPGYEAPVKLIYSSRNRSAAIRVPVYGKDPATKRLEFRCPDPSCNPYLAFAAMTMAAIDGIKNKIDPGAPLDKDLAQIDPAEATSIPVVPATLGDALNALESDNDYLLQGKVFNKEVIHYWIEYKRKYEVDALKIRPHPYEFCMYFDV